MGYLFWNMVDRIIEYQIKEKRKKRKLNRRNIKKHIKLSYS